MSTPNFSDEPTTSFNFGDALKNDPPEPVFDKPDRPRPWVAKKAVEGKPAVGRSTNRGRKPKQHVPPSKPGEFVDDIEGIYVMLGVGVGMRDMVCGQAIIESAHGIAEKWDEVAQSNDAVRKALRTLTKVTVLGSLAAAHVPILMAISQHHGIGFGPRNDESEQENNANAA